MKLFDYIKQSLGYSKLEDFYNLSQAEMEKYGVDILTKHIFQGSLSKALKTAFPEHVWNPWLFQQNVSRGYWNDSQNQRAFMDWVGQKLKFKEMKDWYKLTQEDVMKNGGGGLLSKYRGSPSLAVVAIYPEHAWQFQRFASVVNEKIFMDWLGQRLAVSEMVDWYKLTVGDVVGNGGAGLLKKYRDSPSLLVRSLFPDHNWEASQFVGYWTDMASTRDFVNGLGKKLGFTKMKDLYKLSVEDFVKNGGGQFLNSYNGSPFLLIQSVYPEHFWEPHKCKST